MHAILIANRGEIAVRVIRACADAGYRSIAVYADQDADALHVRLADDAYALPGTTPAATYLDGDAVIAVARRAGADAIHPGYGFLSENAEFARAVQAAGLTWIGPEPDTIDLLGDKVRARQLAAEVGAPLVAGTPGPVADAAEAVAFAEEHGVPVAIKAAFGGGGRGMRVAWQLDDVGEAFESATREAIGAFGRGECFVEQFLDRPRHVEAQVLGDAHGNVLVVGTRDCSLQRRNQKLVEEAPAPFLTDEQRDRIHDAARSICAAAGYRGAATVEFLVGGDGLISFLEVNTRLQVEHPVTEETTGVDLVLEQFRIAEGRALATTETPPARGHAIEFRINAEDPARGFLPMPGTVDRFRAPSGPGVRVDTGIESGDEVVGAFDSLLAKLIVTGPTREAAIARARRALAEFEIDGVPTVLPFDRAVLASPAFTAEDGFAVHTRWIETEFDESLVEQPRPTVGEGTLVRTLVELDGRRVSLGLPRALLGLFGTAGGALGTDGNDAPVEDDASRAEADPTAVPAPISGTFVGWSVEDGASVSAGQQLGTMEAMKMETPVSAHRDGVVRQSVEPGATVDRGTAVARIDEA